MKSIRNPYVRFFIFLALISILGFFALGGNITGSIVANGPVVESGNVTLLFCQVDDCGAFLMEELLLSNEAKCAFYDLDYEPLELVLEDVDLLVFEKNYDDIGLSTPAVHGGLMHNKFCILDEGTSDARLITGSTNPTENGLLKNDNNMIMLEGAAIVENYLQEFGELEGAKERKVPNPLINHTIPGSSSFLIENYFCPEDDCEEHVLEELKTAKESIDFMTFSFTSDSIGDLLVQKATEGVTVSGVFEKRQKSKYSEYQKLLNAGLDVKFDNNPYTMHHKVFIIDADDPARATVITGSYNPTKNGNTRNDENVLIIHDERITQRFTEEFARVYVTS